MGVTISGKIDFKTKSTKKDKEGHYIVIKRSIQKEDITLTSIYAPNIGAHNTSGRYYTHQHISRLYRQRKD